MIKKYIIDLVVGSLLVFVLVQTIYDNNLHPYEDLTFTVGLVMLSVGLITVSGATKMFRGMGFVLKKMFTKKVEGMTFYDYILTQGDKAERVTGYPLLFAGITFVIVSVTIAEKISQIL
ncbi:DUF3899 domain-containing protein [Mycoplasmatota bacterium]|nr:DUF3899 domain-containing protein [Mycoplasmatota bacterium]